MNLIYKQKMILRFLHRQKYFYQKQAGWQKVGFLDLPDK